MLFRTLLLATACVASLAALEARATSVLRRSRFRSIVTQPAEEIPDEEKVQMDPIEVFRSAMCLERDSLIDHEKCLTWMVKKCMKETSGVGSCDQLEDYLSSLCEKEGRTEACEYAAELGAKVEEEKAKLEKEMVGEPAPAPAEEAEVAEVPAPAPAEEAEVAEVPAPAPAEEAEVAEVPAPAPAEEQAPEEAAPEESKAPAPAPAKAEAVQEEKTELEKPKEEVEQPAGAPASAPAGAPEVWPKKVEYSKKIRDLPEHGYNEHSDRHVQYDDNSHASDWQKEWPMTGASNSETIQKICEKNPDNKWCKRYPFPKKKKEEKSLWDSIFR